MRIYPSPANEVVHIHLPNGGAQAFAVFDAQGREFLTGTLQQDRSILPVANWAPGSYVVKVGGTTQRFQVLY